MQHSPYNMQAHIYNLIIIKQAYKYMRKIFIAIFALSPLLMNAQSEGLFTRKKIQKQHADMSAYKSVGAVPVKNGKVTYNEVIAFPGMTKNDIYARVAQWASLRYEANTANGMYTDPWFFKNLDYSMVKTADKEKGIISCVGAEELIFSIKPLAKNYTQAFYTLDIAVSDGQAEFTLTNIYFNVDQGEGKFDRVSAEEWITDEECLNKKGELRRIPGKFRVKTIDLVTELKKEIAATAASK